MEAFRFVSGVANDAASFVPPRLQNPQRKFPTDEDRCSACALSFFVTEEKAREAWRQFTAGGNPKRAAKIGTHLARVPLASHDGVATPADAIGHFDLHEAETARLEEKAVIVEALR